MMQPLRTKVAFTALYSRLAVWAISILANLIIPDHDAGVFQWTKTPEVTSPTNCDLVLSYLNDGLTRWDGQYFLHVSNNGYTYENTLAFFPFYPIIVRFTAEVLYWMQVDYGLVHFPSTLVLAGILVNLASFILAALALYELSRKILKDEYLAYKASLLFCISPASIFFSATYTESLHAFLSFSIMSKVERNFSFKLGLFLALSTATRSNGILNVGFVVYKMLKIVFFEIEQHRRLKLIGRAELSTTIANILGDALVPTFFCVLVSVLPFCFFQWYGFTQFCSLTRPNLTFSQNIIDYAVNHSLKLPSKDPSPWCQSHLPISYSYIQSHYWEVGFLRYFTFRQLPNFLLAAPILYLTFSNANKFYQRYKNYCWSLGLVSPSSSNQVPSSAGRDLYLLQILPKDSFVYVVHVTALAIFATFCMHVQVATRLLASSSPVIYWWAAILTTSKDKKPVPQSEHLKGFAQLQKIETLENLDSAFTSIITDEYGRLSKHEQYIVQYFVGYSVVGTILFANFLPWT